MASLNNIPSVRYLRAVLLLVQSSNLTLYPTCSVTLLSYLYPTCSVTLLSYTVPNLQCYTTIIPVPNLQCYTTIIHCTQPAVLYYYHTCTQPAVLHYYHICTQPAVLHYYHTLYPTCSVTLLSYTSYVEKQQLCTWINMSFNYSMNYILRIHGAASRQFSTAVQLSKVFQFMNSSMSLLAILGSFSSIPQVLA